MLYGASDDDQPAFNDIRIDLRGGGGGGGRASHLNNINRYPTENDQRSQSSIPSRISRYSGSKKANQILVFFSSFISFSRIPTSTTNKSIVFESVNNKNSRFKCSCRRRAEFEKFGHISESSTKIRSSSTTPTVRLEMVSNIMHNSIFSTW